LPIGVYGKDIKERKNEIFDKTAGLIRALVDDGAEILWPSAAALIPYVGLSADLARDRVQC